MNITRPRIDYMLALLAQCRPHNSQTEKDFISTYLLPLPGAFSDSFGNVHVDLRTAPGHRTLFAAHTDTVHNKPGHQTVYYRADTQTIHTRGQCLGADDGAGIVVLLHMIKNNVPGYYIFTRGEEKGGLGAKYLDQVSYRLLEQFDRAICFDRKGTSSVITHMWPGRTCSDLFADALCHALGNGYLMYAPDPTGSYTDSCEWSDTIPECTNISVGYKAEHGPTESLDVQHLFDLMDQVTTINWDDLPVNRDPYLSAYFGPLDDTPAQDALGTSYALDDWITDPATGEATAPHRLTARGW